MHPHPRRPVPDWDPTSPAAIADPAAVHAKLRPRCPVAYADHGDGFWTVLDHATILEVVRDPETFANGQDVPLGIQRLPIETDPPQHTRYRRMLQPHFTKTRVAQLEAPVRAMVVGLLEPLLAAGGGDVVAGLTNPLPGRVLCAVLRFPPEQWADLKYWSAEVYRAEWQERPPDLERKAHAEARLFAHSRQLLEMRAGSARRAELLDPDQDMVSAMLAARFDGEPIDDELIVAGIRLMLTAGHNSTTNALGNTLLRLAEDPELQDHLRGDPARIPAAVEEVLRWEAPVQATPRTATRDVELRGRQLHEGDKVWLVWGAGNRDGTAFADPDTFVADRPRNRHLSFGWGIHKCIGLPVANLELRVMLEELLARTTSFALSGEAVRAGWPRRGVSYLPLTVTASQVAW